MNYSNFDLYGGMDRNTYGKKYGIDATGNNPMGDVLRSSVVGMAPSLYRDIGFGKSLTGDKESAIRGIINSYSGPGMMATTKRAINKSNEAYDNAAKSTALTNKSLGFGDGFNAGINGAIQSAKANSEGSIWSKMYDPATQSNALMAILQAVGAGQNSNWLPQLMSMFAPIEQRSQANEQLKAGRGLGSVSGLLGTVAGLAGGGNPLTSLLGGMVGGKGGFNFGDLMMELGGPDAASYFAGALAPTSKTPFYH